MPDSRTFRNPAVAGYPAQSILWLRFQNATGSGFTCSGSMISSRAFLTAGLSTDGEAVMGQGLGLPALGALRSRRT